MHNLRIAFLLALLAFTPAGHAEFIYNLDGKVTGISGLEFNGSTFEISFSQGIVGDTWSYQQVNDDSWGLLANGISGAVAHELDSGGITQPDEIAGCGWEDCRLFLPDAVSNETDPQYTDHSILWSSRVFFGGTWYDSPGWEYTAGFSDETFGATADISSSDNYLLMTFQPTVVPVPAAAWLLGSALMCLGFASRGKHSQSADSAS